MPSPELHTLSELLSQRQARARLGRDLLPAGDEQFWRGYVAGLSYAIDAVDAFAGTSLAEIAAELGLELPPDPLAELPELRVRSFPPTVLADGIATAGATLYTYDPADNGPVIWSESRERAAWYYRRRRQRPRPDGPDGAGYSRRV